MTRPEISFRWEISAGNVLTMLTAACAMLIGYINLQRDVAEASRNIARHEEMLDQYGARIAGHDVSNGQVAARLSSLDELMREVRDELRAINGRRP